MDQGSDGDRQKWASDQGYGLYGLQDELSF